MLDIQGLTMRIGSRQILSIESLHLKKGETTAVIGRNGAGKSSLLRAIGLLIPASFGRYALDERELTSGEQLELRREIAHVFQTTRLLAGTVLYNVALPLCLRGMPRSKAEQEALQWLDIVQASHLAERRPYGLSGGEAARVGIARALIVKPKLLLLDEPFSALDVESKMHVFRNMPKWLNLAGSTAMIVSHDYAEVGYLAERLLVMDEGRIVADGKPGEVLRESELPFVRDFAALGSKL